MNQNNSSVTWWNIEVKDSNQSSSRFTRKLNVNSKSLHPHLDAPILECNFLRLSVVSSRINSETTKIDWTVALKLKSKLHRNTVISHLSTHPFKYASQKSTQKFHKKLWFNFFLFQTKNEKSVTNCSLMKYTLQYVVFIHSSSCRAKLAGACFPSSFAWLAMSPTSVFVESSQMWFLSCHNHPLLVPARLDTVTDLQSRELCYKADQSHEIQRYWW